MKRFVLSFLLPAIALLEAGEMPDEPFVASPMTTSDALPQHEWDGKDRGSFKGPFASSLETLLAAGLPDPGGLPYRKIWIPTGNCYGGDGGVIDTEGWLLPPDKDGHEFAIAWNGLVYPVVKSNGEASLDATTKDLLAKKDPPFGPFGWQGTEAEEVKPQSIHLIHALFLTRFGKIEAAEALLKGREDPPEDFTRFLADELAFNLYDRAICAHMRGDAKLALASLREMERIRPPLLGILGNDHTNKPMGWASQFDELKAECERRIKAGKTEAFDEEKFLATKPDVTQLIGALDQIAIMQAGQPADVPLWESKTVQALVAIGEPAVEPLLNCLAEDSRFTRSMHFWRDFSESRTVLGVHEAALYALQGILKSDYFILASTGDSLSSREKSKRLALAQEIRADWEHYGKATGAERAYRILADDTAGRKLWVDAAESLFGHPDYDPETGDERPFKGPQPGEVLRDRNSPSVSDLLEKRADDVMKQGKDNEAEAGYAQCDLLLCLLKWEPERGRARIARQVDEWLAGDSWKSTYKRALQRLIEDAAKDSPVLLRLADVMAWNLKLDEYDDFATGSFLSSTLGEYGDSPFLKRSHDGLWTDPKSPWCLAKLDEQILSGLIEFWRERKYISREPFRSALLAVLGDHAECATIMIDPEDPKRWVLKRDDGSSSLPIPDDKLFSLLPDQKVPVRRMDVVAKTLSKPDSDDEKPSPPEMEYWWPEKLRDEQVAKAIELLQAAH